MTVQKNKEAAQVIKGMADQLGWRYAVRGNVLTIVKHIAPGHRPSFVKADGEYYSILSLLPQTSPGSTWGTDGGGIGAVSAIRDGVFTMNKSGGNKRVLAALKKL